MLCPKCLTANRDGARYCDQCAQPLGTADPAAAERRVDLRHGSFVFCDLVQSTELANRLAIEDLRSVFTAFRRCVAEVCARHRGFVIRFVGDGALLSFAFPDVLDDAAESAVRTALELTAAIGAAAPLPGLDLRLRVGVASGTVFVGDLTNEAAVKEEAIVGSVPHLAARLAAIAAPGEVMIDAATHGLAGGHFDYRDVGAVELKGFVAPVRAWQVLAETGIASRYDARRRDHTRDELIGRDAPLAAAIARLDAARAGAGALLSIVGEPGVGKSRLARELCARVGADELIEFDCVDRANHTPLYPVGIALRRLAGIGARDTEAMRRGRARELLATLVDPADLNDAANSLAPLVGLPTHIDATGGQTADSLRERAIDLLVEMFTRRASRGPLVVLVEDLHWCDATTLEMLTRLGRAIAELPVLLVTTSRRPSTLVGPSEAATETLTLGLLDDADARRLARAALRDAEVAPSLVDEILRLGGGVPLFIEELARDAGEGGMPVTADVRADARAPAGATQRLIDIIQPRVDRLGSMKPIVQAAAVIGRDFQLRHLAELLAIRADTLQEAALRLAQQGLLEIDTGDQPGHLRFRHALIHEAVYKTTLRSEQKRLHRDYALLLSGASGGLDATPDVVAYHHGAAERFEASAAAFAQAAAQAGERAAYIESAAHCEAGNAQLDRLDETPALRALRLQLTTQLALAHAATKGYAAPETEAAYAAARALCGEATDPAIHFPIVRGLASFYQVRCELGTVNELCAQGIELAERSGRPEFMIDVLAVHGYNLIYQGQLAAGRAALERCLAMYDAHGGRALTYSSAQDPANAAWSELAIVATLQGDTSFAAHAIERALAHAEALARPFDIAYACCHAAAALNLQRRFAKAQEQAARCIEIALRHGFKVWIACGYLQSGVALASSTDTPDANAMLAGTLAAFRGAGAELNTPYFMWGLARGQARLGQREQALQTTRDALHRALVTGESWCAAELLLLAAELEADPTHVRELLDQAWTVAEESGAAMTMLRVRVARDGAAHPSAVHAALDGSGAYPEQADWVRAALQV